MGLKIENQKPLLYFEFATSKGKIQPFTFVNPTKIISTNVIEEVLPCLEEVQQSVQEGFYAAGFLSYESAPAFDSSLNVKKNSTMPLIWFGIFKEPLNTMPSSSRQYTITNWEPDVTQEEYREAIQDIKSAIEKESTNQVNYTIRLNAQFQGDSFAFFQNIKKAQSANYASFIDIGEHSILCASPELFFHIEDNVMTTRPMKGTVKRGKTFEEDCANREWLYHSEKNRTENAMIVDLMKNELEMIAQKGSVQVPKLFEIEQYPTVHQMTSTITAILKQDTTYVDILKALFPCGSITGAPKNYTMKLISELEKAPREVYCGAIGYISPNHEAIFNVPIRTVCIDHHMGKATYGVGGGITRNSTPESEYEEVLAKSEVLLRQMPEFHLLESLLLDEGNYFLKNEHLNRLKKSAMYFNFIFNQSDIEKTFERFLTKHQRGQWKVRLLLSKSGSLTIEGQPIEPIQGPKKVVLANSPIDAENLYVYHKTTNRKMYESFQTTDPDVFDVLLWNEDREITEFINGNVVLEIEGELFTPPISSGLLAGTFRESLLEKGKIKEKVLKISDLDRCDRIWFINSVRKWIEVQLN